MQIFQYSRGQALPGGKFPRIDWSHPLANGLLLYAIDPGALGGARAATAQAKADLVSGHNFYQLGSGGDLVRGTPYGIGFLYGGAYGDSFTGNLATLQAATAAGNYTYGCAFLKTGSNVPANARPFGRTANNGAAPYMNWDFEINPGSAGQGFINASCQLSGTTFVATPNGAISDNTFITTVGTLSGGAGSSTLSLYVNGALSASTASTLTPGSYNTNDNVLFSTSTASGVTGAFNGIVFYGAFWNRVLTPSEIQTLHLDPYCFLLFDLDELPAVPWLAGAVGGAQGARAMVLA